MVQAAARIGAAFGMDPVAVLDGSQFLFEVRQAAFIVWQEDEKERNKVKK